MKKIKELFKFYVDWTPNVISRIILLLIPLVCYCLTKFKLNNDFWFLINTGKEILRNGFINIEPFTIHSDLAFVPQQWLTDVVFYLIYDKFDVYGMFIFLGVINIIIIFLLYKLFLLVSDKKYKLAIFSTIFIDILLVKGFLHTRPQIFDIVFLLLEIYLLELYIRKNNKKYLYCLPIISIMMINFHASIWPMLFVILVPYYLGRINFKITTIEKYSLRPLIIIMILMLLGGLINPYGLEMMLYLFKSFGLKEINNLVREMRPTNISSGMLTYVLLFVTFLSYYFTKKNNKKINIRYVLLFLGTGYLALSHTRGLLFLLVVIMLPILDNCKDNFKSKNISLKINKKMYIVYSLLFIVIGAFCAFNVKFETEKDNKLYGVSNYLDNVSDKNIKLYTNYDDGGYMEYRGYKCYIDPRAEVFYKANNKKEDIMKEYFNLFVTVNPKTFLDKYDFDYLLVDKYDKLYYYLESLNYTIVYEANYQDNIYNSYRLYRNNEVLNEKNS